MLHCVISEHDSLEHLLYVERAQDIKEFTSTLVHSAIEIVTFLGRFLQVFQRVTCTTGAFHPLHISLMVGRKCDRVLTCCFDLRYKNTFIFSILYVCRLHKFYLMVRQVYMFKLNQLTFWLLYISINWVIVLSTKVIKTHLL